MNGILYNSTNEGDMLSLMKDNNIDALKHFKAISLDHTNLYDFPAYTSYDWVTDLSLSCAFIGKVETIERLENFTKLQTLDLSFTNITQLPKQIGVMKDLRVLLLRGCDELVCLPDTMALLKNLEVFEISQCYTLKDIPCGIGDLTKLNKLTIADCDSLTTLPSSFSNLNVRELDLTGCEGFASLPDCVVGMKSLEKLTLDRMPKIKTLPDTIKQLSELRELSLYNCTKLESLPIDAMGELYNLKKLNITFCNKLNRAEIKVKLKRMLPDVEVKID